jgi:hypothetical protein
VVTAAIGKKKERRRERGKGIDRTPMVREVNAVLLGHGTAGSGQQVRESKF